MIDPHRPKTSDPTWQGAGSDEPPPAGYPSYTDPAYAGQLPPYGSGYLPPPAPSPSGPTSGQPPSGGGIDGGEGGPPEPPQFPRWLFLLAGTAVLLVVGLVIALVITNGSTKKSTTVAPLPTMPSTAAPSRIPTTTTQSPSPTTSPAPTTTTLPPTESAVPGIPQTVVYSVTGAGHAISIAYIDTGNVLQTEFNVVLPWSKQVSLTPPASKAASVTVVNIGQQITCSVTVDGAQVRQRTGTILTICAAGG
ncbi:MAG TPA: MmpS family transport accessory protein [Mycobacterium sp.]|nr:MmpS family transport accessory protein [Mycobacterium sp.]